MRKVLAWASGAALATLFQATVVTAQTTKEWDDVIAAAKREGEVIVYTAYLSPNTNEPIAKAFEKTYGIKISYLAARGSEVRERVRAEQSAGRYIGDVLHYALSATVTWAMDEKVIQPHGGLRTRAGSSRSSRSGPTPTRRRSSPSTMASWSTPGW